MIDIKIFTEMFTIFYFGKYIIIGTTFYGIMRLIKYILND